GNKTSIGLIETGYGVPVDDITNILTVGTRGPALLQDVMFLDTMSSFDRERIPERVVHARGAGAFGYFEVTNDITKYTKASVFAKVGKRTRIAVRFSVVSISKGGADTTRDPRGFAIKFYTDYGIWDLVGNNTPIFFIRDPMLFPLFIHSQKYNPVTNIKDVDMYWDFITRQHETVYQIMITWSDLGTPAGYRFMNGFGSHTFKMVNEHDEAVYVKFHYYTDQGIRNLTNDEAIRLAGTDDAYSTRDLYNAIANKDYPTWSFKIQVMTFEEAERFRWNPFDVTKIWPLDEYPLIDVGKIVLNENPTNYFSDVEQIAFSPARMIPGIEPSPDKLLQGRLFSYSDTQRYRLGTNYLQLPVNCPFGNKKPLTNYQRDGAANVLRQSGAPNYYPNSFGGPVNYKPAAQSVFHTSGDVARYNSSVEDNFGQASMFWDSMTTDQQTNMVDNIAATARKTAPFLQKRIVEMFTKVSEEFGKQLQKKL
ncbi:hypothetical protein L9F63_016638, partial [Diploptera punctata]